MAAGFVSHHSGPQPTAQVGLGPSLAATALDGHLKHPASEALLVVRKLQFDRKRRTVVGDLRHDLVTGF